MSLIGDIDRDSCANATIRYAWLYGRAKAALQILDRGISASDPGLFIAATLAALDEMEAVPVHHSDRAF